MSFLTDLKAHWKLNEESGVRYDARGSNNLADNNTVGYAAGKLGNAAKMVNADTEWLSIGDNADLAGGDVELTIAIWVYLDNLSTGQSFASKYLTTDNHRGYQVWLNAGTPIRVDWTLSSNGTTFTQLRANNFGEPPTGTWFFVVAWHDPVANMMYIQINNGTIDSTSHAGGIHNDASVDFCLGARDNGAARLLDGRVDSVSVWKRLLTAQERTDLYNGGAGLDYPFGVVDLDVGAHALTGQPATLLVGRVLDGVAGSYSLTGVLADLLVGRYLNGEVGAYALAGLDASTLKDSLLSLDPDNYTLAGLVASLEAGYLLNGDAGGYGLTGVLADLLKGFYINGEPGAYSLVGLDAALLKDGVLVLLPGGYTLSGVDVDMGIGFIFIADAGAYSLVGLSASLLKDSLLDLTAGVYTKSGMQANLARGLFIDANAGGYSITGLLADLRVGKALDLNAGVYILSGLDATLLGGSRVLTLLPGTYVLSGVGADVEYYFPLPTPVFPEVEDVGMISPIKQVILFKTLTSRFDDLGEEKRKQKWPYPRRDFTVKYAFISKAEVETLWEFYLARNGAYGTFNFYLPEVGGTPPSYTDEYVGMGDGTTDVFNLPCRVSTGRTVYLAGLALTEGVDYNFTAAGGAGGADEIDFTDSAMAPPALGQRITIDFTGTLKIRSRFAEDKLTMDMFFDRVARTVLELKGLLNA